MKKYNSIAELQREREKLQDGEEIKFRGEVLRYHEHIVSYLLSTREDEELGIGGMVNEDLKGFGGKNE